MNHADLIATAGTGLPLSKTAPAKGRILEGDDLSGIFGLEIDVEVGEKPEAPKKLKCGCEEDGQDAGQETGGRKEDQASRQSIFATARLTGLYVFAAVARFRSARM